MSHSFSRRHFIGAVAGLAAAGAATALPLSAEVPSTNLSTSAVPPGVFCVMIYGPQRIALDDPDSRSFMALIDAESGSVRYQGSQVTNLHGLVRPLLAQGNPGRQFGIGHASPELLDVYDDHFNKVGILQYPGITFRGHGLPYPGGALVAAELTADPLAGGFLLLLDPAGTVLRQVPSGGIRPHEIVRVGKFLAIAHYGDRPRQSQDQPDDTVNNHLMMRTERPGVSFLDAETLEIVAFHQTGRDAATTHLGVTASGQVLTMGINTWLAGDVRRLRERARTDQATLLMSEISTVSYEIPAPMYRISPTEGIVETLSPSAQIQRRGQSFAHCVERGIVASTYAGSQTLHLRHPALGEKWLNTLGFGIADPRGCAHIAGTDLIAVAGCSDNVAVINASTGKLVRLYGIPLGGHSHLFWSAAQG